MTARLELYYWEPESWTRSCGAWKYARQRGYVGLVPRAVDGRECRHIGRERLGEYYITRHGVWHGATASDPDVVELARARNRALCAQRGETADSWKIRWKLMGIRPDFLL